MPSISEIDRVKDVKENIIGSLNLLEICSAKKIKKFIFVSSGGTVYGNDSKRRFKESSVLNPRNSYGVIKVATEKYIGMFYHLDGMNYAILRLSNPYGRKILTTVRHCETISYRLTWKMSFHVCPDCLVALSWQYLPLSMPYRNEN